MDQEVQVLEGQEPVGVQLANQVHTAQKNVGVDVLPAENLDIPQIVVGKTLGTLG